MDACYPADQRAPTGFNHRQLHNEDPLPQLPMGPSPHEASTQRNKTCNVQDAIGVQVMQLEAIEEKQTPHEVVHGQRHAPLDEWDKLHPLVLDWGGLLLIER